MLNEILLFAAGFILGALHQRYLMTKRVRAYAQSPFGQAVTRSIVMKEWEATLKDPTMRPMLQDMLDAANEADSR